MKKRLNKSGQAWVETVIYTLIGLSIIGIVLGVATPKIKELTDKAIIDQTISAMNDLDNKIVAVQVAAGNSRQVSFRIKKGNLIIDPSGNRVYFLLENTAHRYSQPEVVIEQGNIDILTEERENGKYDINLILDYNSLYDITSGDLESEKVLTSAPVAYQLLIENDGVGLDIALI